MKKKKKPSWAEIKNEYETTEISYRKLAEKYRINSNMLITKGNREKWTKTTKKEQSKCNHEETTPNWLEIEQEYLSTDISFEKLAEKYKISKNTLSARAVREKWTEQRDGIKNEIRINARENIVKNGIATAERVMEELTKIGFADIKEYLEYKTVKTKVGEDILTGEAVVGYKTIVNVKDSKNVDGTIISEVSCNKDGTFKFKLHDKMGALEKLGKELGMFVDKKDINLGGDKMPTIIITK